MVKPNWLKVRVEADYNKEYIFNILDRYKVNTVCNEAACPNMVKCYGRKTASFIIMGKNCTRNCSFCNVLKNEPELIDENEPVRIANAIDEMGLKHVVITSVTRDDLPDGGAKHFVKVINELKKLENKVVVEILIPDFAGNINALKEVIEAKPEILAHNIETVPSLYQKIRPNSSYTESLKILKKTKDFNYEIKTKSGLMLGLGETKKEVVKVLEDLASNNCDFVTIGQYLAPSSFHYPVKEFVHPDIFDEYKKIAYGLGFSYVISEPLARSSYLADQYYTPSSSV